MRWRYNPFDDATSNPFESLQAKFQPERTHSSRLVITWSEWFSSFRKNGKKRIPCSNKTLLFKEVDSSADQNRVKRRVHGNSAPALKIIYFWINKFKRGRTCIEDEARSRRPVETTLDIVEKIHDMIIENRRMKVHEIAEAVGISTKRVHNILHEKLHVKKLCAWWVPQLLTLDQKRMRKNVSMQCLTMFKRNPQDFWRRFVTVDETWIHHYTPETK